MRVASQPRPWLLYGAVVSLLAFGVFLIPGIGPALLRSNGFAPHGVCILWQPGLLWFHVTNDLLIGLSYVAIAATLAFLVYKARRDLPFHWVILAFGAFIISCGSTHFMEIWTFWRPLYWLSGYAKLVTAVASVATAIALPPLVPRVLSLIDAARLSQERKAQLEAANTELAQLNLRLQELDELKSQLFANVSHELRTPLTLILGPTERLLDTASDAQRRDLQTVQRNARLLQRHVDDLLDIARIEAGRLELQLAPLDLSRLALSTADLFAATVQERRMQLRVDAPPQLLVQADGEQLQRVLVNLLSNAFKFTPDGGEVALALRAEGERAIIQVEDSGPGVPEELREAIFERFRQGDGGATRRYGGTGLGLAIARELLSLHGGTITVEPSALSGARFTVTIPLGQVAPGTSLIAPPAPGALPAGVTVQPAAAAAQSVNGERPLVLVVDDNAELRQFLGETLAPDYEVVSAADGQEGLGLALDLRPALVVSDVMMPLVGGDELVAAMRRHDELRETPVVMLTARADAELRVRLLREGAQDYLLKPFAAAELRARVANLLAMAQARLTLQRALSSRQQDLSLLSAEAARLYGEAQTALQLRDEFLAVAAHELRTPVTVMLGNAELLARRWERDGAGSERDRRAVSAIGELARRLAALIETLLDVTRLDRRQIALDPAPLRLEALVQRQVELIRPSLELHEIGLELPATPLRVLADAERLEQVLGNLLTNAVKYSPAGGAIAVRVYAEGAMGLVSVSDQGIGIPAEALPRLFERFYRAPNVDRRSVSGFGLGLHLAREIAQLHGGSLTATSVEGRGSTFTLSLPLLEG